MSTGAFWGGLGGVVTRLVLLGSSFLLARILGREVLGEYGVVNTTALMVGGLAGLGIGNTVTKYVAELRNHDPDRASRILALTSVVTWVSAGIYAVLFLTLAPWLASTTLAAPKLAPMLRVSAITVVFQVVNIVQLSSLSGCEAFSKASYASMANGLFQAVLVVLGAWRWQLRGAVWGMALCTTMTVVVTWWLSRDVWSMYNLRRLWQGAMSEWPVLAGFSLPTLLCSLSVGPVLWGCNAFLAHQKYGYGQLGIFNAANQWFSAIQFLPYLLSMAALPVMAERHSVGDGRSSVRVMLGMIVASLLLVVPIGIVLSLAGSMVMSGYGADFRSGHWVLVMSVWTGALVVSMAPLQTYLAAAGRMWSVLALNMAWAVVMVLASWLMVSWRAWGAEGLAGARLIAWAVHSALTAALCVHIVRHSRKTQDQNATDGTPQAQELSE